jgi:valyl-tRNA synthetase
MNIPEEGVLPPDQLTKNGADLWIESRLNAAIRAVDSAMLAYRYNDMGHTVYEFFWNDFCDWYIEATKLELYSDQPRRKQQAASKLVHLLEESLRLMHPFLSFITEEIYQKLPGHALSLVTAPYPVATPDRDHPEAEAAFLALQNLVGGIRRVRSEFAIDPARDIEVFVSLEKDFVHAGFLKENRDLVAQFSGSEHLKFTESQQKPLGAVTVVNRGSESWVLVRDVVDLPKELIKLSKSIEKSKDYIAIVEKKLSNQAFVLSAPAEIVAAERVKLVEARDTLNRLQAYQQELGGLG